MSEANCRASSGSRLAASCWAYPAMVVSELRSPNAISRGHFAAQLLLAANFGHFSAITDQTSNAEQAVPSTSPSGACTELTVISSVRSSPAGVR